MRDPGNTAAAGSNIFWTSLFQRDEVLRIELSSATTRHPRGYRMVGYGLNGGAGLVPELPYSASAMMRIPQERLQENHWSPFCIK
jgi:hypothetical protein